MEVNCTDTSPSVRLLWVGLRFFLKRRSIARYNLFVIKGKTTLVWLISSVTPWCHNYKTYYSRNQHGSIISWGFWPGKSYWSRRLSTVDLLVLTSVDQLYFILKYNLPFFTKQATLMRRSTVLILPPHLVFPSLALAVWLLVTPISPLQYSIKM